MFGYALKRVARGWKGFIALFLGIAIATTLFSGTLLGAEEVGIGMLEEAMGLVPVDIIVADLLRDVSAVDLSALEADINSMDHVVATEQVIRWSSMLNYINATNPEYNIEFTIVALEEDSALWGTIFGPGSEGVDFGEVYLDLDSIHAPEVDAGTNMTMWFFTHDPDSPPGYKTYHANLSVAGFVDIDLRSYIEITGESPFFIRSIILGVSEQQRKPPHDLVIISRETLFSIFGMAYEEGRLPNKQITFEVLVDLDRDRVVNPWDVDESIRRIQRISEQIDNKVQSYELHSWQNFIQDILEDVKGITDSFKARFILIAIPVFFTAWYMGVTVSDVMLGSRRREVGLLLTKGFTRRQIFTIFLIETILVGILSGLAGMISSAFLVPLMGIGSNPLAGLSSLSPSTISLVLAFSTVIALLSVFLPAWDVSHLNVIDALMEHRSAEEERLPSRLEPGVALLLGLYKLLMLSFGLSVEAFRPVGGGMVAFIVYSTWWGFDLILGYLGPILFFWGFTKLFIQGSFRIQEAVGSLAGRFTGDLSKISMLSARRTLRRTAAIAFLIALIFGYSVSVIGGLATLDDRRIRRIRWNVGADASVWLFSDEDAKQLDEEIQGLDGVASTALERWFIVETPFLALQPRAIDPEAWGRTAYFEESWFTGSSEAALRALNESEERIIFDRGLAEFSGLDIGDNVTFEIRFNRFSTLKIVDLLGPGMAEGGQYQPLPSFVSEAFLERYSVDLEVLKARILVRFEPNADAEEFKARVIGMSENVEAVYTVAELLEAARGNIFLQGPRQVQGLGIVFATLVSSAGVILVVSTTLRERQKELTLMAIRGFSFGQLFKMLVIENTGVVAFSILLGATVGYINVVGDVAISNVSGELILNRIVFPQASLAFIAFIVAAILVSVIAPIIYSARRTSSDLSWRIIE